MANPGVGNKFVSVNLNKSYGQPPSSSSNAARTRTTHHGSGGGMVVLSRSRSSVSGIAKSVTRLSVPPPLNLPSLRRENERFDQSSSALSGSSGARNARPGSGNGPPATGWTRPGSGDRPTIGRLGNDWQRVSSPSDSDSRVTAGVYTPPAARSGTVGQQQVAALPHSVPPVEKAVVLKGEDFPTLHATLSSALATAEKQKDSLHQKHKLNEDTLKEQRGSFDSLLPLQMRPQLHSSPLLVGNGSDENGTLSRASDGHNAKEQSRKLDMFLPGSLPVVQLNHTSNWEDDERDTGHGIPKRDSDRLLLRAEVVREREFDTPRVKLPQSFVHDSDGRGIRDVEVSKVSSREVFRVNPYSRDVMVPSRDVRDGSSWKASLSLVKDGIGGREIGVDRNVISARPFTPGRDNKFNEPTYRDSRITPGRDNNFSEPTYRDSGITPGRDNKFNEPTYRDSGIRVFRGTGNGAQDSRYERRDSSYVPSVQNGVHALEGNSRSTDWNPRTCYGDLSNRCNRVDVFQSSTMAKASFSSGSKGLPVNDPILSIGREKRVFSNSGKPYIDDTFDIRDPLSGGLVWDSKMFKRKKDALKQADFRDPVRESFEAELERVQKMQEQERQRVVEEQERALELARREEEERQRLAREEEERRIRLEEEGREAAWSTEQERLGAMKKAEEQKMAREEEKRRVLLEEERRKEAARQKLLALEARIARRKAEATKEDTFTTVAADQTISQMPKGRDGLKVADVGDSQDGETMVEHITNSASSDCSSLSRSCETGSRPHSSRDVNSVFMDRGKSSSFWNKDVFENGKGSSYLSQQVLEIGSHFSRRDGLESGRVVSRKDFHGGPGLMYSQISSTVGLPESHMDDHAHLRGHRRNVGGDGYDYNRNTEVDTEFLYNQMDKFEDIGWGHSQPRGNPNAPYVERFFQNKEVDGFSPFGSSRHSVRQPRVLPPPSLPSMHRGSFRTESQRSSSSGFMDDELKQRHTIRRDEHIMHDGYESSYQGKKLEQSGTVAADSKNVIHIEQKDDKNPLRCDSQSSLSVSSPPDSPTHLSHDDLDDSRDSRDLSVLSAADNGKRIFLSENECLSATGVNTNVIVDSTSVSLGEDGEWAIENNEELQEQEEYDEEEDGYHEEDEVREGARENLDLAQEFEDLHSEKQNNADEIGQMVLCFNDGVQVGMPGDDEFENPPENGEKAIGMESVSVGIGHSGVVGNEHSLQAESSLSEGNMESSSTMKHETEKSLHDVNIKNSVVSSSSLLHSAGVHSSSCIPDEQAVALPKDMSPSQQEQTALPTLSSVPSQAEGPVKLQFGLFSGPSLIPSPVPAIQIGSIQMPLLHPPVGHSLSQFHSSQAPFFQFGQLRYTSAISQGILPLVPQTFSLAQPTISAHYSLNQNPGGSLQNQVFQDSSTQVSHLNDMVSSIRMDDQPGSVPKLSDSFQESISKEKNGFFVAKSEELPPQRQVDGVLYVENVIMPESVSPAADQGHHDVTIEKNHRSMAANSETQGQKQKDSISTQVISTKRAFGGSKAPGSVSGNKGKRFVYAVRNTGSTSSTPVSETSHLDSNGFQRRYRRNIRRHEFRVRENVDRRQSEGAVSSNHSRADEKSNFNGKVRGVFVKGGSKKDTLLNKSSEPLVESETFTTSKSLNLRGVGTDNKMDKTLVKEASSKKLNCTMDGSRSGGRTLLSSAISEDDVDAPLQSGVVRVFKQPGIEAPSDEDDFIEVRSKRQMLNDRREQREKEIKAKSKVIKRVPRKVRSVSQTASISANPNRKATSLHGDNVKGVHSDPVVSDGCASANDEVSAGFANGIASPPLPPIGTPATSTDTQADGRSLTMKSVKTSSPIISSGGTNLAPGSPFVNNNAVLDNVVATFGSWANVGFGQQVIALTQNQLDEAMKPARLDTNVAPIGDNTVAALESEKQSMSILQQDRSFSSAASPLTSLLAGEKIQFGAVTSPTILPPSSLPVSISIGPSGPCQADSSLDHNVPASDGGCTIYFDKDKQPDGSCVQLEDPEAEAEAAASAVAVAAISSDELVGSGMGTSSTSVSVTKSFAGGDIVGFSSAVVADQQFPSQSRGEESLTLALPADLSVETPSLPLWPPLPSPHNSSGPMFSHFPVAPPSHFPCFEMNPMFGGPVFAFGPHDESGSTRPQSQKSSTPATGSLGAWQPCHSDIDSFYGPSGFTGPFISPGGIPRVQGPPHMVVYNHFAPVGQFGQLGLSFMGTTYIPSGKQPDWKHPPTSSATGISEGDINVASGQLNPPNMPAPIRHLAPGSPLLPMASPLAMFELSPFQSSADVSAQACWSCLPTSSHHPAAPSLMPLQQQAEGGIPSQFSHGMTVGTSNMTSFQEPCSMTPSEVGRNVPQVSGSVAQFSNELGLVDPSSARIAHVSTSIPTPYNSSFNGKNKGDSITKSSSRDTAPDASDTSIFGNNSSINGSDHSNTSALKAQHIQQQNSSAAHHLPPIGYTEQRGKVSQEGGSSGGNGHHRSGFQRRNQISGVDKKFAPSKTRQIYVAKPATSVPTTNV